MAVKKENKINIDTSMLSEILVDSEFSKLDKELQHKIIDIVSAKYEKENKTKNGKLSELLGSSSANIPLYIVCIMCASTIIVGLIYICLPLWYKGDSNIEFWKVIIPIITTSLGYIFGKSTSK